MLMLLRQCVHTLDKARKSEMSEYPTYLIHYGIPGQKWGTRRWQNEDGSLTPEGREHYGYGSKRDNEKLFEQVNKSAKYSKSAEDKVIKKSYSSRDIRRYNNKIANIRYKRDSILKKASKNKAMQEAMKDEKLVEAKNKWLNTDIKYTEPDFDTILQKVSNKYLKPGEYATQDTDAKKYYKIMNEADKQYDKEYKKFEELYKKDPSVLAFNEYTSEVSRVAKKLAAKHANVKIGDITYQEHLEKIIRRYI